MPGNREERAGGVRGSGRAREGGSAIDGSSDLRPVGGPSKRSTERSPEKRPHRDWIVYFAVFLAAALVHAPSLRFGFIGFDDTLMIVQDQAFLQDAGKAPQAFLRTAFEIPGYESSDAYYRPLVTLSLMADAQIGGTSPWIYHLTNVLLHMAASLLVLLFLRRLASPGTGVLASGFLAMLFAVHPAFVGVVDWIPGRVESLLAVFTLGASIAFLRHLDSRSAGSYLLHLLLFALAVFAKELGAMLPLVWLSWLLLAQRERLRAALRLAPGWLLILMPWFLLRQSVISQPLALQESMANLAGSLVVILQYLGKVVVPFGLSVTPATADTPVWPGLLALLVLGALLLVSRRRRWSVVGFGLAWFLILTVPTLIVPRMVGFEQRLYLPTVGVLAVLHETGAIRRFGGRRWITAAGICIVLVFGILTVRRVPVYEGRQAFWENAVATAPSSSYARASLGALYLGQGRVEEARAHYLKAVELNPWEPKANNNLGVIAGRAGRLEEAAVYFQREIEVNPGYADAYFNLAQTLVQLGRVPEAAAMWERTLEIRPDHQDALKLLAWFYESQGQPEKAAEYRRRLPGGR